MPYTHTHTQPLTAGAPRTTYLCRADGLTQLAGDAALLPIRVPPQCVLATEPGAQGTLLKRVVDGGRLPEEGTQSGGQSWGSNGYECFRAGDFIIPLIISVRKSVVAFLSMTDFISCGVSSLFTVTYSVVGGKAERKMT